MSRPAREDGPTVPTSARLSPEERVRVEDAARANRQSLSDFGRAAMLEKADRTLPESGFRKPIR